MAAADLFVTVEMVSLKNFNHTVLCPTHASNVPHRQLRLSYMHHCTRRSLARTAGGGDELATEFSRLVNETGMQTPRRSPTHLLSPPSVIAAQLEALQRNDWPEKDAGIRVAYSFSKPFEAETSLTAAAPSQTRRAWTAKEEYLDFDAFNALLHSPPYQVMLECDSWEFASQLMFPSQRHEQKAVQAVVVAAGGRSYTFTFCLERIEDGGYKGCWLTVGVRQGDYTV